MSDETEANPETGAVSEQDSFVARIMQAPSEDTPAEREEEETEAVEAEVDEAEEDASEADDDATAADEPDETEAEPEPETFTVKVDGEEITVTRDELLKGYQRDADYRRKTQALAEQRKQIEQAQSALMQRLQELGSAEEQVPDWAKLATELDPWDFQQRRTKWEADQAKREKARAEAAEMQQRSMMELAKSEAEKLKAAVPEWRDFERFKSDWSSITPVALEYGYTDAELGQLVDHRAYRVLKDAAAYRRMKAESDKVADKKKAAPPKSLKPGSPVPKAAQKAADQREVRKQLRTARNSAQERDAFVRLITGA